MFPVNFVKFVEHVLDRGPPKNLKYIKNYKRIMPLDASEEFLPSNKGKMIIDECF